MEQGIDEQRDHIIVNLEALNRKVGRQMQPWFMLFSGVMHGLGFVIGSTLLVALVLAALSPFFGDLTGLEAMLLRR